MLRVQKDELGKNPSFLAEGAEGRAAGDSASSRCPSARAPWRRLLPCRAVCQRTDLTPRKRAPQKPAAASRGGRFAKESRLPRRTPLQLREILLGRAAPASRRGTAGHGSIAVSKPLTRSPALPATPHVKPDTLSRNH